MLGDRKKDKIQILRNIRGRKVGEIIDGCLFRRDRGSRNRFRLLKAWGWNIDALIQAYKAGVSEALIFDKDTATFYHANLDDFERLGELIHTKYGAYFCLPLRHRSCRENKLVKVFSRRKRRTPRRK